MWHANARCFSLEQTSVQLKICAVNFHLLVQLPLSALKQILLAFMRRQQENCIEDAERNGGSSSIADPPIPILTVTAPKGFNAFSIHVTSSANDSAPQKMFVQFQKDTRYSGVAPEEEEENALLSEDERSSILQLRACARCGRADHGCACGWRTLHSISPSEEDQSLLEAIDAKLVSSSILSSPTVSYTRIRRLSHAAFECWTYKSCSQKSLLRMR